MILLLDPLALDYALRLMRVTRRGRRRCCPLPDGLRTLGVGAALLPRGVPRGGGAETCDPGSRWTVARLTTRPWAAVTVLVRP